MPTDSDFKAAVEGKNAALIEAALVKRVPYVFAEGENIQDWVSTEDGTTTLAILNSDTRTIFWLDPDDTTSVHDGVSVCVSSDGKRYHATEFRWPTSILAVGEETPPVSPNLGDAYQLGAAPTGDWSSNAGDIAIYTSRGWMFLSPPGGLLFYNVADGLFYYLDENGDFITITIVPGPDTVRDTAIIGGARRYIVENQTTNDPPAPLVGVYYIVGPSPTGSWIGQTGKIATSYDGATWTFITPTEGVEAYDRERNVNFLYNSGWVNAGGAFVDQNSGQTAAAATLSGGTAVGTSGYSYSDTTAPSTATSNHAAAETHTLFFTASAAGVILEFDYAARADISMASFDGVVAALVRDSESAAIDWQRLPAVLSQSVNIKFRISAGDASAHTYKVVFFLHSSTAGSVSSQIVVGRRRMFVREAA